jgi:uncharacterized protein
MTSKSTITLGVLIIASAAFNVYLFQKNASLENTVGQLLVANRQLNNTLASQNSTTRGTSAETVKTPIPSAPQQQGNITLPDSTSESITAVAVKAVPVTDGFFQSVQYEGTTMDISVDIRQGRGLVLVNTEVPTGVDFQTSARTAVAVAQSLTGADLSRKDVIFSIKSTGENSTSSDLQAVDGPSAGAAMTVLLASELGAGDGSGLNHDVVMTGTINLDGKIGPVGGVPEKAMAAGQSGAKIFLVPSGQATYNEQSCEKRQEGPFVYQTCKSQEKPLSDYTEKNYDMKVIEVRNITEALSYYKT